MIGVISKEDQHDVVEEFFQLFKTPWEFYDKTRCYDVVLTTENEIYEVDAKLLLIYGSEEKEFDSRQHIIQSHQSTGAIVESGGIQIPIYGRVTTFEETGHPLLRLKGNGAVVGLKTQTVNPKIIRVGYDLFEEVRFLLTVGQPSENAHIPTLDLHILFFRNCILENGNPLVEIPPVPYGYDFIACLTHDVDFVRIRDHFLDHTMLGFVYRASMGSLINFLRKKMPWWKVLQNWKALLSVPFIHLGIARDIWLQFDRYLEVEGDLPSTFFLIPYKNHPGTGVSALIAKQRAAKYDVTDIQEYVKKLLNHGSEIGVHGIDGWHSAELAHKELNRISKITGQSQIGVRVHYLCFDDRSPGLLEKAGFSYDATFGYNDTVGYRAGTVQAFRPLGAQDILELPLSIQDTALFSSTRMNLSEAQAWKLCKALIEKTGEHGGVITLLWHQRSLAPERLWGDFYVKLLQELSSHDVWFGTAGQVINWFRSRRAMDFDKAEFTENMLELKLKNDVNEDLPPLMIRIHHSKIKKTDRCGSSDYSRSYIDIPWKGKKDLEIPFSRFEK